MFMKNVRMTILETDVFYHYLPYMWFEFNQATPIIQYLWIPGPLKIQAAPTTKETCPVVRMP